MPISGGQYRLQFQEYFYSGPLAAGASFIPAARTIVKDAQLGQKQSLDIFEGLAENTLAAESMGPNEYGYTGLDLYCDGTSVSLKNVNVAAGGLVLRGLSMA